MCAFHHCLQASYGGGFLLTSQGNEELILNTLAITFIIELCVVVLKPLLFSYMVTPIVLMNLLVSITSLLHIHGSHNIQYIPSDHWPLVVEQSRYL